MKSKNKWLKIGGVFFLLGLLVLGYFFTQGFNIGRIDDYTIYDDFDFMSKAISLNSKDDSPMTIYNNNQDKLVNGVVVIDDLNMTISESRSNYEKITKDEKYTITQRGTTYSPSHYFSLNNGKLRANFVYSEYGGVSGIIIKPNFNFSTYDIKFPLYLETRGRTPMGRTSTGFTFYYDGKVIFSESKKNNYISPKTIIGSNYLVDFKINRADRTKRDLYVNGEFVEQFENSFGGKLQFIFNGNVGFVELDYIRYRPLFNCEVEPDEVTLKDTFSSDFSIDDLSYPPIKFCPESYPVILRNIEKGITADIRGDITRALASGETIEVKDGEVMIVGYIADYTEGINERCIDGQSYNTQTNRCEQYIFEAPDVKEVIRDTEFVSVGDDSISFKNTAFIGNIPIITKKPKYLCGKEQSRNSPQPSSECWEISVLYDGKEILFYHGRAKEINPYMEMEVFTDVRYESCDNGESTEDCTAGVEDDFINTMIITIKDKSFITSNAVDQKYYVKKNNKKQILFNVTNKLTELEGGIRVDEQIDLINEQKNYIENALFKKGSFTYGIDADTSTYGEHIYVMQPFVKIGGRNIFAENKVITNIEVVDEIPENVLLKKGGTTITESFRDYTLYWVFGVISLISIIGLIVYYRRK